MILQASTSDVAQSAQRSASDVIRKFGDIDFVYLLVLIGILLFLMAVVRRFVRWATPYVPQRYRLYALGVVPIVRLFLIVIGTILVVQEVFVIKRENIFVIGGAIGVVLGFAFKDLAASLIAGVVAVFEKPYRPGDWIRIEGSYGEVKHVGLRSVQLVTPSDDTVTITHDRIWSTNIINSNDGAATLMCVTDFYLEPDHDAEEVRRMLREVAVTSPYLSFAKPVLVVMKEEPWGSHYMVKAYPFDMRDQFRFISDIAARGKGVLRTMGVREIVVPVGLPGPGGVNPPPRG